MHELIQCSLRHRLTGSGSGQIFWRSEENQSDRIVSAPSLLRISLIPHSPCSFFSPTPIFLRPDFYLLMTSPPSSSLSYIAAHSNTGTNLPPSRTQIWLLMNLQIVSHVPTHFICFPGNIAIGPFENTLRGRDSPSLDRRVLHKAEVGMTDHLRMNELLLPSPVYFSSS